MRFRALVRLVEKVLKMRDRGDEPRADMYLPDFLLAFGLVLIGGGLGLGIAAVIRFAVWMLAVAPLALGLGITAVLCWKNQTIRIISDEAFEYTTSLGNIRTYRFADITGLRKNNDSMTLFVGKDKVHIESMAILSDHLVDAVNAVLKTL